MPIPIKPFMHSCGECGWKQLVEPRGDVLPFLHKSCPDCDSPNLQKRAPSLLDTLRGKLKPARRIPW